MRGRAARRSPSRPPGLLLETRQAWWAARGIRYFTLITPARHAIYDDKLPAGLNASPNRAAIRLLQTIAPVLRACALYPEAELRAARAKDDVFFRTDEHMNDFGAHLCYRAILRAIGPAPPMTPTEIESFATRKGRLVGNLGIRLASEPSEQATILDLPGKRLPLAGIRNKKATWESTSFQ
jgi:SGNH hydrolase-like domain, acetyltransferase AlgX